MSEKTESALTELLDIADWEFEQEDQQWYYEGMGNPKKAAAELAQLRADLDEAHENLLSMVNQYCCRTTRPSGTPETYSHDFMSTGEEAFDYLVRKGLAKWCVNGVDIFDLQFPSSHPERK